MMPSPFFPWFSRTDTAHVFTHYVSGVLPDALGSGPQRQYLQFDQRALLLATADDVVCVLDRVEPCYLDFLAGLGLGPRRSHLIELVADSCDDCTLTLGELLGRNANALERIAHLLSGKNVILNPYFMSSVELELAAMLERALQRPIKVLGGDPAIATFASQKHHVRAKAQELGVPLARGEVVQLHLQPEGVLVDVAPLQDAIGRQIKLTKRVIVRKTDGAAGNQTLLVDNHCQALDVDWIVKSGKQDSNIFLVETFFEGGISPNILMFIDPIDGSISCAGITTQRLNDVLGHEGNIFPAEVKVLPGMLKWASVLARWLCNEGYAGFVGFDFVEFPHPRTGFCQYVLAEINPRVNAVAYPLAVMEKLTPLERHTDQRAFLSATITTACTSFAELADQCGDLFFNPDARHGAVPYNAGLLRYGKCDVVFLGPTLEEVRYLYDTFLERTRRTTFFRAPNTAPVITNLRMNGGTARTPPSKILRM